MASARMGWRWLTRMKTALIILGILGVLTLLATVIPQEPNVASTVADWRTGAAGPGVAVSQLIDVFGLYDTYGSATFLALLLLLFLSLTACLIPRIRAFVRLVRRGRPPLSRNLSSQPHHETWATDRDPDTVREDLRGWLGDQRWRLRAPTPDGRGATQIAAEKGLITREGGSLLFHLSFYVLLIAIVAGQLLQFVGQVGVIEGQAFTDTSAAYWTVQPGRWFGLDDHRGFRLELDDFRVDWVRTVAAGGTPSLFEADVAVTEDDGTVRHEMIEGNVPMVVDDFKIHLLDWGYAPVLQVRVDDELVWEGSQASQQTSQGFYRTAVKAPDVGPDEPGLGIQVGMYPYAPANDDGTVNFTGAPWDDAPVAVLALYRGDLGLDGAQDVNVLDTDDMDLVTTAAVALGETVTLADGVEVAFPELQKWAGFQVSYRPTVPLLLVGALLLLVGLIPALYAYRRRLWIEVEPDGTGGSIVTVAGRSFQRSDVFARDFDQVTTTIARRTDVARRHEKVPS